MCVYATGAKKRYLEQVRLSGLFADENRTVGIDCFVLSKIEFQKFIVKVPGDQQTICTRINLGRQKRMPALNAPCRFNFRYATRESVAAGVPRIVGARMLRPRPSKSVKENTAIIGGAVKKDRRATYWTMSVGVDVTFNRSSTTLGPPGRL